MDEEMVASFTRITSITFKNLPLKSPTINGHTDLLLLMFFRRLLKSEQNVSSYSWF